MRLHARVAALPRSRVHAWTLPAVWARTLAIVIAGAIVAGFAFLYLWQGCAITALKAQRAQYILALAELERERAFLAARLEQEMGITKLMERAKALGMCPYPPERIIHLEDDQGTGH